MFPENGQCKYDGLYYWNVTTFILCSNGFPYEQHCAFGSQNSAYEKFNYDAIRTFCDVNRVDLGLIEELPVDDISIERNHTATTNAAEFASTTITTATTESPATTDVTPKMSSKKTRLLTKVIEQTSKPPPPIKDHSKFFKEAPELIKEPTFSYHGLFQDQCGLDGLYYGNEDSFIFCVNGNPYVQPCAPGTRNSPYQRYTSDETYSHRDFCDVNLVVGRYVSHEGYGYEYAKPSFYYGEVTKSKPDAEKVYETSPPPSTALPRHDTLQTNVDDEEYTEYNFFREGKDDAGFEMVEEPQPFGPIYAPFYYELPRFEQQNRHRIHETQFEEPHYTSLTETHYAPVFAPPIYELPRFLPPSQKQHGQGFHRPQIADEPDEKSEYLTLKEEIPKFEAQVQQEPNIVSKIDQTVAKESVGLEMLAKDSENDVDQWAPSDSSPVLVEIKHEPPIFQESTYESAEVNEYNEPKYTFQGNFTSVCADNGLYYRGLYSFVYCHNGAAVIQGCPPGTMNPSFEIYEIGGHYSYRDFCYWNLVDDGYTVKYGYAAHAAAAARQTAAAAVKGVSEPHEVVHSLSSI